MKLLVIPFLGLLVTGAHAQALHLEAENAHIENAAVQIQSNGFSGTGYVGDFSRNGARVSFDLPAIKAGIYGPLRNVRF